MTVSDDRERGVYSKYYVERVDGTSGVGEKHENCWYWVLDIEHDEFSIHALKAYIDACTEKFPLLAKQLANIVRGYEGTHESRD